MCFMWLNISWLPIYDYNLLNYGIWKWIWFILPSENIITVGVKYELFSKMKNLDVRINNEGCSIVCEILEASIQSQWNYISFVNMKLESQAQHKVSYVRKKVKIRLTREYLKYEMII